LLPELEKLGVDVSYKPKGCDITISYSNFNADSGSMPKVLRMDGVHILRNKLREWQNDEIVKDMKKADAIIWQSQFCRRVAGGILGYYGRKSFVIFNGDDPKHYENVEPIQSPYQKNVVFSCKWNSNDGSDRLSKRFKESTKIARDYGEIDKDVCFWFIGNYKEKRYECDRIRYVGWLEEAQVKRYLKMADLYVFIPWFDWCPNSLVEAMTAGNYVICSNQGGHAEIVEGYGTVLPIDKTIAPKSVKEMNVPAIDRSVVLHAIKDYFDKKPEAKPNPAIHIERIARKYKETFEEVLGGH